MYDEAIKFHKFCFKVIIAMFIVYFISEYIL